MIHSQILFICEILHLNNNLRGKLKEKSNSTKRIGNNIYFGAFCSFFAQYIYTQNKADKEEECNTH